MHNQYTQGTEGGPKGGINTSCYGNGNGKQTNNKCQNGGSCHACMYTHRSLFGICMQSLSGEGAGEYLQSPPKLVGLASQNKEYLELTTLLHS